MIVPFWGSGFGSQIHVVGAYLALALVTDRIAIITETAISKYIHPLSNCCVKLNFSLNNISDNPFSNSKYVYQKFKPNNLVPSYVQLFLKNSTIMSLYNLHYWRIQSSRYVYKLKPIAIQKVKNLIQKNIRYNFNKKTVNEHPCINVWIRHGDKYKEMKLIEANKYFIAIELMKRISKIKFAIYLSTDDRNVINEFVNSKYNVFYLNYSRYNDGNIYWKKNHIYNVLSDIELSLKCKAFIGTRKSNINRLIDELRSTSESNSNIPYFEIGSIQKTNKNYSNLEIPEFW